MAQTPLHRIRQVGDTVLVENQHDGAPDGRVSDYVLMIAALCRPMKRCPEAPSDAPGFSAG
jgi:hypothetical protein